MKTDPLARAWKTTEGVITIGLGIVIGVLTGIDPATLPHKYALIAESALAISLQFSRSWVKANGVFTALQQSPDALASLEAEADAAAKSDPVA